MLSAYTIVHTDSNYALWMNSAFFYSGITANLQTIGQPYDLYTDSAGLLWYLPGIEGASNQPVYLSDGVTQAAI